MVELLAIWATAGEPGNGPIAFAPHLSVSARVPAGSGSTAGVGRGLHRERSHGPSWVVLVVGELLVLASVRRPLEQPLNCQLMPLPPGRSCRTVFPSSTPKVLMTST